MTLHAKARQPLPGPLQGLGIDIQADQRPRRAQLLAEQKAVTSVSNGHIDHHPILRTAYLFGQRSGQDRNMFYVCFAHRCLGSTGPARAGGTC